MQELETIEDVEAFMLKHGESIVDMLGGQIDRIEIALKVYLKLFFHILKIKI